jgi:hypothetical protein
VSRVWCATRGEVLLERSRHLRRQTRRKRRLRPRRGRHRAQQRGSRHPTERPRGRTRGGVRLQPRRHRRGRTSGPRRETPPTIHGRLRSTSGPAVNSPANETRPSLSWDGKRSTSAVRPEMRAAQATSSSQPAKGSPARNAGWESGSPQRRSTRSSGAAVRSTQTSASAPSTATMHGSARGSRYACEGRRPTEQPRDARPGRGASAPQRGAHRQLCIRAA